MSIANIENITDDIMVSEENVQPLFSGEKIRDLADVLRGPLTGKNALIPMGTKAFIPGSLQPNIDSSGEELVTVKTNGIGEKEMRRRDVIRLLEKEMKDNLPNPKKSDQTISKTSSRENVISQDVKEESIIQPCFEIRETIDQHGRQVSGERIDITRQVEYFERQAENDVTQGVDANDTSDDQYGEYIFVDQKAAKTLSEQDYLSLSSRLEELAKLEEESEKKQYNLKSSKAKTKGWNKGFLNKTKSKGPTSSYPVEKGVPAESQNTASSGTGHSKPTTRRVGFHQENQVREIPRIGERSVKEIQKIPGLGMSPTMSKGNAEIVERHGDGNSGPVTGRPIEESLLSSVVQERRKKKKGSLIANPQKPPSRFLQERHEIQ